MYKVHFDISYSLGFWCVNNLLFKMNKLVSCLKADYKAKRQHSTATKTISREKKLYKWRNYVRPDDLYIHLTKVLSYCDLLIFLKFIVLFKIIFNNSLESIEWTTLYSIGFFIHILNDVQANLIHCNSTRSLCI